MLDAFKIGHRENQKTKTGCSVIIAESGAVGGVSVRGGAPGTLETDLFRAENAVSMVNAIVLAGGSAFGLEASCGVMQYLHEQGVGYDTGDTRVPIVSGAVIYDLGYGQFDYPTKEMGYQMAEESKIGDYRSGNLGAGIGATLGKIMGVKHQDKGGLGVAIATCGEVEIGAMVVVNAFGDVVDDTGCIMAGCHSGDSYIDTHKLIVGGLKFDSVYTNTTIGCIFTNATLTKAQANKLADTTHNALAQCIRPVATSLDGDTIFVMASGDVVANEILLGEIAIDVMKQAIYKAVAHSINREEL